MSHTFLHLHLHDVFVERRVGVNRTATLPFEVHGTFGTTKGHLEEVKRSFKEVRTARLASVFCRSLNKGSSRAANQVDNRVDAKGKVNKKHSEVSDLISISTPFHDPPQHLTPTFSASTSVASGLASKVTAVVQHHAARAIRGGSVVVPSRILRRPTDPSRQMYQLWPHRGATRFSKASTPGWSLSQTSSLVQPCESR